MKSFFVLVDRIQKVLLAATFAAVAVIGFGSGFSSAKAADNAPAPVVPRELNYNDFVGRYPIDEDFVIDIVFTGGRLYAQPVGQDKRKLKYVSEDRFVVDGSETQFSFTRGADGKVDTMILHKDDEDRTAKRQPLAGASGEKEELKLTPEEIAEYVGDYEYKPDLFFKVSTENGVLLVQAPNQARLPVFAEKKDQFFYKVADATISFARGPDGRVTSLVLHQRTQDVTAAKKK